MQSKKLSLIIMLTLILIFFSMIMAYLAFSNGGDQKKITELENNDKILNQKIEEMKLRTDEWDKIINGTTEVDLGTEKPVEGKVVEKPAPVVTPTPPAEAKPGVTYSVKATNVNMRSKPSSNGSVVRAIPNGEKLTPTGNEQQAEGYLWLEVIDSKGNKGWAAKEFLQ
jgi:uncharacterized protein YgiM (DUF1202 family)